MNAAYLTPAITLFNEDGTLDLASQERLFDNLIDQGVDGILDHLSRHRVDRCRAYRLVETGFCDAANTDTAVDSDEIFPGFHVALNRPFCFLPLSHIQLQIVF